MEVRRLGRNDSALGVHAIKLLKSPDGYPVPTVEDLTRFLSLDKNILIVALDGDLPVGYVVAYLLDRVDRGQQMMFFYEVGVSESHRRRGIATRMVAELKAICRAENVMKMWVPTSRSNLAATRLYERTGAVTVASEDEVTYAYSRESFAGDSEPSE